MIRPQCMSCGKMTGAAIKRETLTQAAFAALPLWDDTISSRYWGAFSEELRCAEAKAYAAALAEARANYDTYREGDRWKKKCA